MTLYLEQPDQPDVLQRRGVLEREHAAHRRDLGRRVGTARLSRAGGSAAHGVETSVAE